MLGFDITLGIFDFMLYIADFLNIIFILVLIM